MLQVRFIHGVDEFYGVDPEVILAVDFWLLARFFDVVLPTLEIVFHQTEGQEDADVLEVVFVVGAVDELAAGVAVG